MNPTPAVAEKDHQGQEHAAGAGSGDRAGESTKETQDILEWRKQVEELSDEGDNDIGDEDEDSKKKGQAKAGDPDESEDETEEEEAEEEETETEEEEETEEAEEEEEEEEEEQAATPEQTGQRRQQFRFRPKTAADELALKYTRQNPEWDLARALEAAHKDLGTTGSQETKAESGEAKPAGFKTVADVDAKIAELKVARRSANAEMDFDKKDEIQEEIETLLVQRGEVALTERDAQRAKGSQEQQQWVQQVSQSEERAFRSYPATGDPKSPLSIRMVEIEKRLEQDGNDLGSNKAFLLAQMAGNELGIAPAPPVKKKVAAAAPATAPSPQPAKKRSLAPIAPGSAGTQGGSTRKQNQREAFEQQVDGIKNTDDYEAAKAALLGE